MHGASAGDTNGLSMSQDPATTVAVPAPQPQPQPQPQIIVRCVPVGAVPRLKKTKFKVDGDKPFAYVIAYLQRQTGKERLFVYCNASFAPPPDVTLAELYLCFKSDSTLVVNYCDQQAYG